MAQYKKNNKKPSAKSSGKKSAAKEKAVQVKPQHIRNREISGIIFIAIGILLFVSVLLAKDSASEGLGAIGGFLADSMYVLAGQAAIIFPVFLLVFGGFVFAGRFTGMHNSRILGLCFVLFSVLGLLHIKLDFLPWDQYMLKSSFIIGGGALGAFFAFCLQILFGRVLSTIILIFVLIIGALLLTKISLIKLCAAIGRGIKAFFAGLKLNEEEIAERESRKRERLERIEKTKTDSEVNKKVRTISKPQKKKIVDFDPNAQNDFRRGSSARVFVADDDNANAFSPIITDVKTVGSINPDKNAFGKEFMPEISVDRPHEDNTEEIKPVMDEEIVYENNGFLEALPVAVGEEFDELDGQAAPTAQEYILPQPELMSMPVNVKNPRLEKTITDSVTLLENTLSNFGVKATVTQVVAGPAITRYELQPAPGVKVSRIVSLTDDIALALAAPDVRIEAPIPGRSVIGIEIPREESTTVYFREMIESDAFKNAKSKISFALGKDISGNYIIGDLAKMPHLLVAGATGTGKSVCINSFICSILYKAKPDEVKFLLIDPKKVEMTNYSGLPHLNSPVVTEVKKAAASLKWVVNEMENRYDVFASEGVRNFDEYNAKNPEKKFCHIVVIIDELADLMMTAKEDVEQSICRLAQMARAAGIHLVIATQRPSVDVLTGVIKANIPSRIAFAVSSGVDSRTILDMNGAERLIGKGDMLYSPIGTNKPTRVQGTYISDKDVEQLVLYCKAQANPQYCEATTAIMEAAMLDSGKSAHERTADDKDPLFYEAARLIIASGQASTSYLQRRFSIGNPRAGRLIDCLADNGVVGGPEGSKPRKIIMTAAEFEEKFGSEE